MEYDYRATPEVPLGEVEQRFDVDADVIYKNRQPTAVWFRYLDESGAAIEHTFEIDDQFNTNLIYGGLMSWVGYFTLGPDGRKLVAVQLDAQRFNL